MADSSRLTEGKAQNTFVVFLMKRVALVGALFSQPSAKRVSKNRSAVLRLMSSVRFVSLVRGPVCHQLAELDFSRGVLPTRIEIVEDVNVEYCVHIQKQPISQ